MRKINSVRYLFLLIVFALFNGCESSFEENTRLKIGIFGGSQSVAVESQPVKVKWRELFNAEVFDCGKGGAGYGLWQENNVFKQINENPSFDVYILWCSTNDVVQSISEDHESNPKSQSGGLLLCLNAIKKMNPKAKILLFTSIPVPKVGYIKCLGELVNKQIAFCEKYNVNYLNQFDICDLTISDFKNDELHLYTSGYLKLEVRQTIFLSKYISK